MCGGGGGWGGGSPGASNLDRTISGLQGGGGWAGTPGGYASTYGAGYFGGVESAPSNASVDPGGTDPGAGTPGSPGPQGSGYTGALGGSGGLGGLAGLGLTDGTYGSMDSPTGGFTRAQQVANFSSASEPSGGGVAMAREFARSIDPIAMDEARMAQRRAEASVLGDNAAVTAAESENANSLAGLARAYARNLGNYSISMAPEGYKGYGIDIGGYVSSLGPVAQENPGMALTGALQGLRSMADEANEGNTFGTRALDALRGVFSAPVNRQNEISMAANLSDPANMAQNVRQTQQGNMTTDPSTGQMSVDPVGLGLSAISAITGLRSGPIGQLTSLARIGDFAMTAARNNGYDVGSAPTPQSVMAGLKEGFGGGAQGDQSASGYDGPSGYSDNPRGYSPELGYALASSPGALDQAPAYDNSVSLAMQRRSGQNQGYRVSSPQSSDPYARFRA